MTQQIQASVENGVLTLTINRPEKKNALTANMYATLAAELVSAAASAEIRVVALHGTSGVFTSGNDIQLFTDPGFHEAQTSALDFMQAVANLDKPLLAGVCGHAVGIGATLLLHCDYVVASEEVRIVFPFTDLALCPEFGSSLLLPLTVGYQRASEWMLLGAPISAGDAQRAGLVNRVLPADMVHEEVSSVAMRLAAKPEAAVVATRLLMKSSHRDAVNARMKIEADILADLRDAPEAQEIFYRFLNRNRSHNLPIGPGFDSAD